MTDDQNVIDLILLSYFLTLLLICSWQPLPCHNEKLKNSQARQGILLEKNMTQV